MKVLKYIVLLLLLLASFLPIYAQNNKSKDLTDQAFDLVSNGENAKAFDILASIDPAEVIQNDTVAALYCYTYGCAYYNVSDKENAIFYFERTRIITEKLNFIDGIYFYAVSNLIQLYLDKDDYSTAAEYGRWVLVRGGSTITTHPSYPSILASMGNAMYNYEDPDAYLFYIRAQEAAETIYDKSSIYYYTYGLELAKYYHLQGKIQKAQQTTDRLIDICNSVKKKSDDLLQVFNILLKWKQEFNIMPEETINDTEIRIKSQKQPLKWLIQLPYDVNLDICRMHMEQGEDSKSLAEMDSIINANEKNIDDNSINQYIIANSYLVSYCNNVGLYEKSDSLLRLSIEKTKILEHPCSFEYMIEQGYADMYISLRNTNRGRIWLDRAEVHLNEYQWYDYSYISFLLAKSGSYIMDEDYLMAKICVDLAFDFYFNMNNEPDNRRPYAQLLLLQSVIENKLGNTHACIPILENIIYNTENSTAFKDIYHEALVTYSYVLIQCGDITKGYQNLCKLDSCQNDLNDAILCTYKQNRIFCLTHFGSEKDVVDAVKEYNATNKKLVSASAKLTFEEREDYLFNALNSSNVVNYGILLQYPNKEMSSICYDNALWTKNLLSFTNSDLRQMVNNSNNTLLINKYNEYLSLKEESIYNTKNSDRASKIDQLNHLEIEILSNLSKYGKATFKTSKEWQQIKDELKNNEVAIEIISVPIFADDMNSAVWQYAALLVSKQCEAPEFIPLGMSDHFSKILDRGTIRENVYYNHLYKQGVLAENLYKMLWEPLMPYLKDKKTLYISAIGEIEKLNLPLMVLPDGHRIQEYIDVRYVTSTADILTAQKDQIECKDVVLYGGITYENKNVFADNQNNGNRGNLAYLEGSKVEIENLKSELDSRSIENILYMGSDANEESFKALSGHSPSILHIATHGFFLKEYEDKKENKFANKLLGTTTQEYSMLSTGLLMAGANSSWNGKETAPGIEDGILTADEIARLDLNNTQLAVLSACESGLGEIDNICGTMGLQRAFKMAGVKSIIMSLWKVDDEATQKLMVSLYKYLLQGVGIHESLKKAQDDLREQYPDPYYWAAFEVLD